MSTSATVKVVAKPFAVSAKPWASYFGDSWAAIFLSVREAIAASA